MFRYGKNKVFLLFNFNNESVMENFSNDFLFEIGILDVDQFKRNMILDAGFNNFSLINDKRNKELILFLKEKIGVDLGSPDEVLVVALEEDDVLYELIVPENYRYKTVDRFVFRKITSKSKKILPIINVL